MSAQAQPIISVGWVGSCSPALSLPFFFTFPLVIPSLRPSATFFAASVSFSRTPKRRRQRRAAPKERGGGEEGRRRGGKWQTLSCHEALDVFILPRAVPRERRIRPPSPFGASDLRISRNPLNSYAPCTKPWMDVVKGCRDLTYHHHHHQARGIA